MGTPLYRIDAGAGLQAAGMVAEHPLTGKMPKRSGTGRRPPVGPSAWRCRRTRPRSGGFNEGEAIGGDEVAFAWAEENIAASYPRW